jgi:hypothetical protein
MVNDLRIYARLAQHMSAAYYRRPAEMRYRYLLGVKKSQVQILSARQCGDPGHANGVSQVIGIA